MKLLIAFCLIIVTLSIAFQCYMSPTTLREGIIPTVVDMNTKALDKLQAKTDHLMMVEQRVEDLIGSKCMIVNAMDY